MILVTTRPCFPSREESKHPSVHRQQKHSALEDPQSVMHGNFSPRRPQAESVESVSYANKVLLAALAPRQSVARARQQQKASCSGKARTQSLSPGSAAFRLTRSCSIFVPNLYSPSVLLPIFIPEGFFTYASNRSANIILVLRVFVNYRHYHIALYRETVKICVSAFYGRCSGVRTISLAVCSLLVVFLAARVNAQYRTQSACKAAKCTVP